MEKYITTYFINKKEVTYEEWSESLKKDLDEESKHYKWDFSSVVQADIFNGRDVEVNGNLYERRTAILYDSAKELLKEGYYYGLSDEIYDMLLEELSEEEIFNLLSKLRCVEVKDGKLLLKDEKDWK